MTQVFAYIRVSTVKQGNGVSLKEQEDAIKNYAISQKLEITEWFCEKETAAKIGRPVWNRMISELKAKKAFGLVIHKIDRSARNLSDWAVLGKLMDDGVQVHFAHERLDLTARGGRLSADLLAVIAADYIRNLRDEAKKGLYGRLKQGIYPFQAPLGYLDNGAGNFKTIDPVKGPLVKEAFYLYAKGNLSLRQLQKAMEGKGLKNKTGGVVAVSAWNNILRNPFYCGLMKVGPEKRVFLGKHPALIKKSLFDRVQSILDGRFHQENMRHQYTYRRLFRCANCNLTMIGETQKGHVYYRCHTRSCPTKCVREDHISEAIYDALKTLRITDTQSKLIRTYIHKRLTASSRLKQKAMESLKINSEKIETRLSALLDTHLDGDIDKETYRRKKQQLLEQKIQYDEHIQKLKDERGQLMRFTDRILEQVKNLYFCLETKYSDKKRKLVETLTSNRFIKQKKPLFEINSPFKDFLFDDVVLYGGHLRNTDRTWGDSIPKTKISHETDEQLSKRYADIIIEYFYSGKGDFLE